MAKDKIEKVMGELKRGELHSGSKSGPKVTSPKQAKAIAMSEAAKSKKGGEPTSTRMLAARRGAAKRAGRGQTRPSSAASRLRNTSI